MKLKGLVTEFMSPQEKIAQAIFSSPYKSVRQQLAPCQNEEAAFRGTALPSSCKDSWSFWVIVCDGRMCWGRNLTRDI